MTTLQYYFDDESYVVFKKYTIDQTGVIKNKKTGKILNTQKQGEYNSVGIYDDYGKQRYILIGRAIISTFLGHPPTSNHTTDHIDRNPLNDTLGNIRWLDKSGQVYNRSVPTTNKSAFIIVNDGLEKTNKEWLVHLKEQKTQTEREYTESVIKRYAQKKQHGFSYKKYPDLHGEQWKTIPGSENDKGKWQISNRNRVKYITKYAENVLSGERLGLTRGYPSVRINGKNWRCHILAFITFFPEEYAAKKINEIVLHKDDDKLDFRPHTLRLGTREENGIDAHDNGKHDGTKTARMRCASYINGVLEKDYESQQDAVKYLKSIGFEKANCGNICIALKSYQEGKIVTRYDRTWKTNNL